MDKIEIELPEMEGFKRIMIPIDIPINLFNAGAVVLYASKLCGWSEIIENEQGISAMQAAAIRLRGLIKEEQRALISDDSADRARLSAMEMFDSAFNK